MAKTSSGHWVGRRDPAIGTEACPEMDSRPADGDDGFWLRSRDPRPEESRILADDVMTKKTIEKEKKTTTTSTTSKWWAFGRAAERRNEAGSTNRRPWKQKPTTMRDSAAGC